MRNRTALVGTQRRVSARVATVYAIESDADTDVADDESLSEIHPILPPEGVPITSRLRDGLLTVNQN